MFLTGSSYFCKDRCLTLQVDMAAGVWQKIPRAVVAGNTPSALLLSKLTAQNFETQNTWIPKKSRRQILCACRWAHSQRTAFTLWSGPKDSYQDGTLILAETIMDESLIIIATSLTMVVY